MIIGLAPVAVVRWYQRFRVKRDSEMIEDLGGVLQMASLMDGRGPCGSEGKGWCMLQISGYIFYEGEVESESPGEFQVLTLRNTTTDASTFTLQFLRNCPRLTSTRLTYLLEVHTLPPHHHEMPHKARPETPLGQRRPPPLFVGEKPWAKFRNIRPKDKRFNTSAKVKRRQEGGGEIQFVWDPRRNHPGHVVRCRIAE
jgi:hypothetical protein